MAQARFTPQAGRRISAGELARIQAEAQEMREEARRVRHDWARALRLHRRQGLACRELLRHLWEHPA